MTSTADLLRSNSPPDISAGRPAETTVRLVAPGSGPLPGGPCRSPATVPPAAAEPDRAPAAHDRAVRSWPLLVLALPAAVAVWSGWVGIGQMTGFGEVRPLPGIWGALHLNTAVTLPVGVEAYAAYALRAWLSTSNRVSARTRRFARRSAMGSLLLGMAGASRLPPAHPIRGHPRAVGHHHRSLLPTGPGLGHGRRACPPSACRRTRPCRLRRSRTPGGQCDP